MGKIRLKTIGDEQAEQEEKQKAEIKRAEKKAREEAEETKEEPQEVTEQTEETKKDVSAETSAKVEAPKTKKSKFAKSKKRSANYLGKVIEIDKYKSYSLSEALELLRKVKMAKFDETVELHINTTEAGISGMVKLPHGTGKEVRVAIVHDAIIGEVEKGKINFDVLIAEPSMMPKLARVAKVLGPRGLMPNPKNGTISQNPEEAAKKFQGGQIGFKTEAKNPLLHVSVGKTSFTDEQLSENIQTMISAIKKARIAKAVLKSTMSPAIKVQI